MDSASTKQKPENRPRVTARLSAEDHELVERAAMIKGFSTVNSFVVSNMVELSKAIVEREERIQLSQRDAELLIDALDRPARDLPKLRRLLN
nr:DUF1778 domain-containing protein [Reinekea blandensis]